MSKIIPTILVDRINVEVNKMYILCPKCSLSNKELHYHWHPADSDFENRIIHCKARCANVNNYPNGYILYVGDFTIRE